MVCYGNEGRQLWAAFPGTSKAEAIAKAILWVAWPLPADSQANGDKKT